MHGELLSVEDVYEYLGGDGRKRRRAFTREQITRGMHTGIIRSVVIGGRYYARRTDVDSFLEALVMRGIPAFDAIPVR